VPSPNAPVGQVNPGLNGWAIPIATLIAALIAATFLTINEALKRRAEDKRQWDKEVRDLCVNAVSASNQLSQILWDAHSTYHPEPKPRLRERLRTFRAGTDDNPLPWPQRYSMSRYAEAAKLRQLMDDWKEHANLIAPAKTRAAFEALATASASATSLLSHGLTECSRNSAVATARQNLIDAVKEDLRVHTYFSRTRRVLDSAKLALSRSHLFGGLVSPPRAS
jgi:hypothetical protein